MKVLFLDIDGCFNTHLTPVTWTDPDKGQSCMVCTDPEKVFMLNCLIDRNPDIAVVLSSAWRADPNWRETMKANGCVFEFFDRTPDERGLTSRGTEIQRWMDDYADRTEDDYVTHYAIIDDNADMLEDQMPNFFKCAPMEGLTADIIRRVEEHLTRP